MTQTEVIDELKTGKKVTVWFGIRSIQYKCGENRISKRTFDCLVRDKKIKIDKIDHTGMTTHYYVLKK